MTDWGVVIATVFGPILAVTVTRWNDERKSKAAEKLAIFKTLMSARGNSKSFAFVDAINVIDVIFYGSKEIVDLKNEYVRYKHVTGTENWKADESVLWARKDNENFNRLLKAIAKNINVSAEGIGEETTVFCPVWLNKWTEWQISQGEIVTALMKQPAQKPSSTHDVV